MTEECKQRLEKLSYVQLVILQIVIEITTTIHKQNTYVSSNMSYDQKKSLGSET